MSIENIIATIKNAARLIDSEAERKVYAEYATHDAAEVPPVMGAVLGSIEYQLMQEVIKAAAKSSGRSAQLHGLSAIVKCASREDMRGTFATKSGARAVCDGYRGVRITNNAVTMPTDVPLKTSFDFDALFHNIDTNGGRVSLPDVATLKSSIKAARAAFRQRTGKPGTHCQMVWRLDSAQGVAVYVNPVYLIDMIEAMPGADVYAGCKSTSPLYFVSADGDGILLPVNHKPGGTTVALNENAEQTA